MSCEIQVMTTEREAEAMLDILWADVSGLHDRPLPPLSAYRRKKLDKTTNEAVKDCSAGAELLLIRALLAHDPTITLPLQIEADPCGKPCLADHAWQFSLSHSSHYAACAISDGPVGLDLQILSRYREELVRRFFSPGEQQQILSCTDRDACFTRIWCRKESFLKAIGLGLRLPLSSFDLSGRAPEIVYENVRYAFREATRGELFFCACTEKQALPPSIRPRREMV